MKECIICKKGYEPINTNQITCCKEHFRIHRKQTHKEYCRSEKYKQYAKQYYNIPNNIERKKKYMKIYKQTDKYKQSLKTDTTKEYFRDYHKHWDKTIIGRLNMLRHNLKRIAAKNSIIELFTPEQFMLKASKCNGFCPSCHNTFDNRLHLLTLDHFYAVSRAYIDFLRTGIKRVYTIDDVGPLCKSCNCSKQDKLLEEVKPKHLNTSESSIIITT